jgi:2-methylcitrate dehydratase PrpD
VRGKAGLAEYTDEAVNDPQIRRVRECATAVGDPSLTEDQARIEIELSTGEKLSRFVEQSLGNIHRPMTDRQLEEKFRDQAVRALPEAQIEPLIALCWHIDELDNAGDLVKAAVPFDK